MPVPYAFPPPSVTLKPMDILQETPRRLVLRAPAKVNLYLDVLGRRRDGFHEIDTIMQTVSLYDTLEFRRDGDGIVCTSSDAQLETDDRNLVVRAVGVFAEKTGLDPAPLAIHIEKHIPMGAGLGGGSSDAAAALLAMDRMFATRVDKQTLAEWAASLGSDVPFFVHGGTARCRGRGERVTAVRTDIRIPFVLLCPDLHVSTGTVYQTLRENTLTASKIKTSIILRILESGDIAALAGHLYNHLETAAFETAPRLSEIKRMFAGRAFAGVLMSGSGSSFFGIPENRGLLEERAEETRRLHLGSVFCVTTHSGAAPPTDGSGRP